MAGNIFLESVREDDFVEYFLFPLVESQEESQCLRSVLSQAEEIIRKCSEGYLWHKDGLKLEMNNDILRQVEGESENLPPHLHGVSHYGDNIEDEWFMVFILRQLSKEITGSVIRVHDSDGEFMLIEAAEYLPSWANPDTCANRVYIYEGNVHLVAMEAESSEISVPDAVKKIRNDPSKTLATEDIQNSIRNKLDGYPDKIPDGLHRATAYIPSGVATILKHHPGLIAPAIQAFCDRDPDEVRVCRAMKYFPPENRVMFQVTFTKCLYAMLTSSKYFPDRVTGWKLPPGNSKEYKSHMLGVKIACGFEILANRDKGGGRDKGWEGFLGKLKERGYFRDFLEGSRDYTSLLEKAKEYYKNHSESLVLGQGVVALPKNLPDEIFDPEIPPDDDDESWLDVSPEELDKMLQEKYGHKKIFSFNNNSDSSNFTRKLSTFLNKVSDVEGIEFPREPPSEAKSTVSFDPDSFASTVQNILDFVIPDDSWNSDSDLSEYEDERYFEKNLNLEDEKIKEYMDEMDKELAATTIGESFEKKETFDDIENFKPVDIDVNALKNILESYRSQMGEAGPSSNMLGPMGVRLDPKSEFD